jgi:hypothetical protein
MPIYSESTAPRIGTPLTERQLRGEQHGRADLRVQCYTLGSAGSRRINLLIATGPTLYARATSAWVSPFATPLGQDGHHQFALGRRRVRPSILQGSKFGTGFGYALKDRKQVQCRARQPIQACHDEHVVLLEGSQQLGQLDAVDSAPDTFSRKMRWQPAALSSSIWPL